MWSPKTLLAGLLALCLGAAIASADVKVGSPFPDLSAARLEGNLPSRDGRVVLVDFWASWCAPCKESFPFYSALQTELSSRGFTLLAISVDEEAAPYRTFVKQLAPTFPTLRDADQNLVAQVAPPAMPTCYLLDRKGVIRLVHTGFHGESDAKKLRAEILKLLDEKP